MQFAMTLNDIEGHLAVTCLADVTINCSDNCFFICVHRRHCQMPILAILQLPADILLCLSLLSEPYQKLFLIHGAKIELLTFNCKNSPASVLQ